MNYTECSFTNNYIAFLENGDSEIGSAIYVYSPNYMNMTNCIFQVKYFFKKINKKHLIFSIF